MMAGATCLIAGASSATPDGGVCFLDEFFVTADAFALGQVLNFRSMTYFTDYYSELCPLNEATPARTESPALPPPPIFLGANLEVLARLIWSGLGSKPTM
jgi:hypothetical protein